MKIRDLTLNDRDTVVQGVIDYWVSRGVDRKEFVTKKMCETYEDTLLIKDCLCKAVIDDSGMILGSLAVGVYESKYNNEFIAHDEWWSTLEVLPKKTRLRVAMGLLSEALKWLNENGIKALKLGFMEPAPDGLIRFLLKNGFKLHKSTLILEVA